MVPAFIMTLSELRVVLVDIVGVMVSASMRWGSLMGRLKMINNCLFGLLVLSAMIKTDLNVEAPVCVDILVHNDGVLILVTIDDVLVPMNVDFLVKVGVIIMQ